MSWSETHRRWQALREVETLANATSATELPWNSEYAEIFSSRDDLIAALRNRWERTRRAQLDSHLTESMLEEQRHRLLVRNAGVLRLLGAHDAGLPVDRAWPAAVPSGRVSEEGTRVPA
jgi:hypothetical protein